MIDALDHLNREWTGSGRPPLEIGIGISSGDMVAGNIGSATIQSYTVIGDTVNLGARLEALNKDYRTRIIISDQTPHYAWRAGADSKRSRARRVLAHEVIHVTEKHTMKALQKNKALQMGAGETLSGNAAIFNQFVEKTFDLVYAGFGRGEELEADAKGAVLADKVGYAPTGLSAFLRRLTERNKSATQQQGLFASHPEMQERLDKLSKQMAADKLTAGGLVADRYKQSIAYAPKPQTDVVVVPDGAAGVTAGSTGNATAGKDADKTATKPSADDKGKRGFGLSKLLSPGGGEKKSSEVTGSGASRGVDTERTAVGGAVPTPVVVTLTASDIAAFKNDGQLK